MLNPQIHGATCMHAHLHTSPLYCLHQPSYGRLLFNSFQLRCLAKTKHAQCFDAETDDDSDADDKKPKKPLAPYPCHEQGGNQVRADEHFAPFFITHPSVLRGMEELKTTPMHHECLCECRPHPTRNVLILCCHAALPAPQ